MRFRIIQLIHRVDGLKQNPSTATIEYVIQKKHIFGWKEIMSTELKSKRISHKTYEDAEAYMFCNYMGHGRCTKINNEYIYEVYTYSYP